MNITSLVGICKGTSVTASMTHGFGQFTGESPINPPLILAIAIPFIATYFETSLKLKRVSVRVGCKIESGTKHDRCTELQIDCII